MYFEQVHITADFVESKAHKAKEDTRLPERIRKQEDLYFQMMLENLQLQERIKNLQEENLSLRESTKDLIKIVNQNEKSFAQLRSQISQFRNFVFQWFSLDEKAAK